MNFFDAIILGIVEGISEFLPISSTGHLVLTTELLNIQQTDFVKSFEIAIQLGAILSIIVIYRNSLLKDNEVWKRIIFAFAPTALIGLIFYKVVKDVLLGNSLVTIAALFFGGLALIILELLYKEKDHHLDNIDHLSYKNAFFIGVFQSISIIPGVSRAASTIIGGLFLGLKRKAAAEFSFLLAIPTILSATGLDILQTSYNFTFDQFMLLTVGFITSFITALFAVKFFISYLQKNNFIIFGIYRILLAAIFFLFII